METDAIGHVDDCRGRLLSVEKDGVVVLAGEVLQLPFAPSTSDDAINKRIDDGVPQFLDVLVKFDNNIAVATKDLVFPASIDMRGLFEASGTYIINVVVSAPNTKSTSIRLRMERAPDYNITVSRADAFETVPADAPIQPGRRLLG